MIDWHQLDRLVVFMEGVLFVWIVRVIWKELIPDIKGWIQELKENSPAGTGESNKKIYY